MASTRNINSKNNYKIEQNKFSLAQNYNGYENSQWGSAYNTLLPGFGSNPVQLPREKLARDAIKVESDLFGIGATNLVNPTVQSKPQEIFMRNVTFFDRLPFINAEPLVIEKDQRPLPFS
jgi:hypothetical protein